MVRLLRPCPAPRPGHRQAVSYIHRGDIFQANICLRLEASFAGDPVDAFCRMGHQAGSAVCVQGSVDVPALLRAEAHPGVWHLVSDVRGTLTPGADDGQLIAAAFPPGLVTGAPKVRAMEIIHELEAVPRETYFA